MLRERYDFFEFTVFKGYETDIFKNLIGMIKEEERIISWNEVHNTWMVELKVRKETGENKAKNNKIIMMLINGFEGKRV